MSETLLQQQQDPPQPQLVAQQPPVVVDEPLLQVAPQPQPPPQLQPQPQPPPPPQPQPQPQAQAQSAPQLQPNYSVSQNMYRIGDYVYIDAKGNHPYLIRRIEEFNKNAATGQVEIRTTVCYRRRDVSSAILRVADGAHREMPDFLIMDDNGQEVKPVNVPKELKLEEAKGENDENEKEVKEVKSNGEKVEINGSSGDHDIEEEEEEEEEQEEEEVEEKTDPFDWGLGGLPEDARNLTTLERFRLRQREVYPSRKEEKLSVNHIRGKIQVNLLSEIETSADYLNRDDIYFYSLVYDPEKLSMLADKGAIRVGKQFQAVVPDWVPPGEEKVETDEEMKDVEDLDENKENGDLIIDEEPETEVETEEPKEKEHVDADDERSVLVYTPYHNLSNRDIDRYLVHVRAIGVFARLLDPNSSSRYPSAQMLAALSAKDSTTQYAMCLLHKADYNIAKACDFLIPPADMTCFPLSIDEDLSYNTVSLGGPLLVRDQLEEFSAAEGALFEEGLDRMGKDFSEIRAQMMPWKTLCSIVDYYYLYKTTNRYIDGRKKKMSPEKDNRLQQVYVPNTAKDDYHMISGTSSPVSNNPEDNICQSCKTDEATTWFKWGTRAKPQRLCPDCWVIWRKYGALLRPHPDDRFDNENPTDPDIAEQMLRHLSNAQLSKGGIKEAPKRFGAHAYTTYTVASPSDLLSFQGGSQNTPQNSNNKNRPTFTMKTNLFTRMVRRVLPKNVLPVKKYARTPFSEVEVPDLRPQIGECERTKMCEAVKSILKRDKEETDASKYQDVVTHMVAQYLGCGKRPRPVSPSDEPPAKRATIPTYPCIADDAQSSSRGGNYCFFSGPKFRQRRRDLTDLYITRRISRRPNLYNDTILAAPLAFLVDFVNSQQSHN